MPYNPILAPLVAEPRSRLEHRTFTLMITTLAQVQVDPLYAFVLIASLCPAWFALLWTIFI